MPYNTDHPPKIADLIALLIKAPRTGRELAELTGMHLSTVRAYLFAFHAEGFVHYEEPAHPTKPRIYVWDTTALEPRKHGQHT
jgi:DNA-binding IclR family transcriptional regulator